MKTDEMRDVARVVSPRRARSAPRPCRALSRAYAREMRIGAMRDGVGRVCVVIACACVVGVRDG